MLLRALATLLIFAVSAPAATVDANVEGAQRLFSGWLEAQMAYRQLPGVAIGVVHDQELIWAKGFGLADVEKKIPMEPTTKFRMASHTKLFTSTAMMQLRDAGKVRLDDPVTKYLPWFRIQPADPDDPPITIEELLTHSSGLPREAGPHWTDFNFPDAMAVRKYVAEHSAAYSPEVRWKYSNLALGIAGMIVEALSEEKYADYVQRHIFDPLHMTDSSIDRQVDGIATGYGRRMPDGSRAAMPFINARALGSATGLTSTVEDMAKFISLQFRKGKPGGDQILSTGALREMHRVRVLEDDWTRGNAIGFAVTRVKDKVYVGHGGSYPGYQTHTLINLEGKVGVIVLTNGDDSNPGDLAMHLMQTVGEAVAKSAATPKTTQWDPAWRKFAGLYRSRNGDTLVVELNQRLVSINPVGPNPEVQSQLIPIGNGTFRLEAASGGAPVGEVVRFVEENGRVTRMYVGESYSERLP
jgi:CubicO group peptidase (beta-lactamase class C family)